MKIPSCTSPWLEHVYVLVILWDLAKYLKTGIIQPNSPSIGCEFYILPPKPIQLNYCSKVLLRM